MYFKFGGQLLFVWIISNLGYQVIEHFYQAKMKWRTYINSFRN